MTVPFMTPTLRALQGTDWELGPRVEGDHCATREVLLNGQVVGTALDTFTPGKGRWRALDLDGVIRGQGLAAHDAAAALIREAVR